MELYHYGEREIKKVRMSWTLVNSKGDTFRKGQLQTNCIEPATVASYRILYTMLSFARTI